MTDPHNTTTAAAAVTIDGRTYASALAPHIEGLVSARRAAGFSYADAAYELWRLDRLCVEEGLTDGVVTRALAEEWAEAAPGEGGSSRLNRMSALRQLALHERSLGLDAHVPRVDVSVEAPAVYLPTPEETRALFGAIDAIPPHPAWPWMAPGYAVAFRLMRLCGLRISECAGMALADVDEAAGTLLVRRSKGDKDRLVYPSAATMSAVGRHAASLPGLTGGGSPWLFPGKDPSRHILKNTFDRKFAEAWDSAVGGGEGRRRRPTPHSLRHAFVVDRMNLWMERGVPLAQMMPYLARYLGHADEGETLYYYHLGDRALDLARGAAAAAAARVIPEAVPLG